MKKRWFWANLGAFLSGVRDVVTVGLPPQFFLFCNEKWGGIRSRNERVKTVKTLELR